MREFSCFLHNVLRRIEVSASAPPRLLVSNDRPLDLRILFNPSRKTGWSSTLGCEWDWALASPCPRSAIVTLGPRNVKFRLSTSLGALRAIIGVTTPNGEVACLESRQIVPCLLFTFTLTVCRL